MGTGKTGISTWKNYSIYGENSVQRRFGIMPIVRCRTPIDSMSTPWGNLRGDPWFGTTLARYLEPRDRAAECADAEVREPTEDFS
jgi:hypothetical protein